MKNIKLAEFKLLIEANSLESVVVVRTEQKQVWKITATTKGHEYQLCPESRESYRTFSSLENACKCIVKAGCYQFEVDAEHYALEPQIA